MSPKVDGTIVIEGMIEGRVPPEDEAEARLRDWVEKAASSGLPLSFEWEGGSFNLVAAGRAAKCQTLGTDPAATISHLLQELLRVVSPSGGGQVFSTLRSAEYQNDTEIQSIFVITGDGEVNVRQRTVEARTTPAPRALTRREKLRLGALGLAVLAAVVAISAFFVDYPRLLAELSSAVAPLDAAGITIEAAVFEPYFTVEGKAITDRGRALTLSLKRSARFPITDSDLESEMPQDGGSVSRRLALEALASGYVRCEFFGERGSFVGFAMARIRDLARSESAEISIAIPPRVRPERVVITY